MVAYAGFWLRVIAVIIDAVVVDIIGFLLGAVLSLMVHTTTPEDAAALAASSLIGAVIGLLYWAVLESSPWQATLGKLAVGIRVTDLQGQRISFGRALGRTLAKILSGLILMIGYLMVAFTERKQGLHDMIAGTLVVKRGSVPAEPASQTMSGAAPDRPTPR